MDKIVMAKQNRHARENTEGAVIRNLRGERSLRDCAEWLNENIPAELSGASTTFASVHNWEDGVNQVSDASLLAWQIFYPKNDQRHKAALDILTLRKKTALAA